MTEYLPAKNTEKPDVLDANGVAKLLGIHINTVYRLLDQGKLPGKKVGSVWRFRRDLVLQLLDNPKPIKRV